MRKMTFIAMMLGIGFIAFSCKSGNKAANVEANAPAEVTVYQIDDVLANGDELIGQEVELEGVCTHICKHGGRKIFLMGSDDNNTIRIESGELGAFDQKCVNSLVHVKGKLVESRIDEAYLKTWEEEELAKTAEQHGDGEAGCDTEKKARGETGNSALERIESFRNRINAQKEKNGKDYLSFYHIEAQSYEIL